MQSLLKTLALKHNPGNVDLKKMLGSNDVPDYLPRVAEFYDGKGVFLTGATGFVGSVLLETLLRCCPGIKSIFILIRTKKNVAAELRKEEIFNKKIFKNLKEENPELFRKVCAISGDICLPNLGLSADDLHLFLEEVSIVFHCAAIINFNRPLEYVLKSNVLSLNTIIGFCRKMRKFEVLVYTSTAYSNCNHKEFTTKEEIYRLSSHAGEFLDAIKNEDNKKLGELILLCKPDWPNNYCFSKCLAENLIMDTASDITVAIVRPSIIISTWKHPISGYWEEFSGPAQLSLAIGKGFIEVLKGDPDSLLNLVPCDIVAKTHVLAASSVGTKRCASPFVVNCTASENLHVKVQDFFQCIVKMSRKFPLPCSFADPPNLKIVRNKYLYYFLAAFYNYLPAIVFDHVARILGKRSKIYIQQKINDNLMNSVFFFLSNSFEFATDNIKYLERLLCPEEKQNLSVDFKDADILEMVFSLPENSSFHDWKADKKSQCERQRIKYRRYLQTRSIQGVFILACSLLIYWVFSSLIP